MSTPPPTPDAPLPGEAPAQDVLPGAPGVAAEPAAAPPDTRPGSASGWASRRGRGCWTTIVSVPWYTVPNKFWALSSAEGRHEGVEPGGGA